jgi:hypothetical protein
MALIRLAVSLSDSGQYIGETFGYSIDFIACGPAPEAETNGAHPDRG